MSAKRELLLREKEFLQTRVRAVQKDHADAMSKLRNAEHAHCVTEMEVERRSTMLLQKQAAECEELRHALDVYDEINYADDQRLSMALRDLQHAHALLREEQGYVRDLWGEVKALLDDIHAEGTKYRHATQREPHEMAGLQADLLTSRFVSIGVKNRFSRYTTAAVAERYEKEQFEQHLFTQAIDKLRALEDERGRMIKGFMKASENASDEMHKAEQMMEDPAAPVLRGVVTKSSEPTFAERARRLADQRYGSEDLLIKQAAMKEEELQYADATLRPSDLPPVLAAASSMTLGEEIEELDKESAVAPASPATEKNSKRMSNASTSGMLSPSGGAESPRKDLPIPVEKDAAVITAKKSSVASTAPPSLTWHGRRVGIRHVDPV